MWIFALSPTPQQDFLEKFCQVVHKYSYPIPPIHPFPFAITILTSHSVLVHCDFHSPLPPLFLNRGCLPSPSLKRGSLLGPPLKQRNPFWPSFKTDESFRALHQNRGILSGPPLKLRNPFGGGGASLKQKNPFRPSLKTKKSFREPPLKQKSFPTLP